VSRRVNSVRPDDETRKSCGDVLLVGGTFFLKAKLVLENGCFFPVDIHLKISPRTGITFPKVLLAGHLQKGKARPTPGGAS
jgi:hypothetical protein